MKQQETKVIRDLAALDTSLLLQMDPIPPVLIELVTLMAVIAADSDWKIFQESGVIPYADPQNKDGHQCV